MKPEDFDIDEPMGSIGDPHDRFDQCDAKENGVGERCSFEMGHDGDKHSFDYDMRHDIHDYFGLGCHCKPWICHGDNLAYFADLAVGL